MSDSLHWSNAGMRSTCLPKLRENQLGQNTWQSTTETWILIWGSVNEKSFAAFLFIPYCYRSRLPPFCLFHIVIYWHVLTVRLSFAQHITGCSWLFNRMAQMHQLRMREEGMQRPVTLSTMSLQPLTRSRNIHGSGKSPHGWPLWFATSKIIHRSVYVSHRNLLFCFSAGLLLFNQQLNYTWMQECSCCPGRR